jgi:hypothetical protein
MQFYPENLDSLAYQDSKFIVSIFQNRKIISILLINCGTIVMLSLNSKFGKKGDHQNG